MQRWSFNNTPTSSTSVAPLPAGWEERHDPSTGRSYFVDHNTKRTVWDRPGVALPAAVAVASDPLSRDTAELQQILPHVGPEAIRQELLRTNGDKQRAIDALLARQPAAGRAPLPLAHGTAVPVHAHAPAKPAAGGLPLAVATAVPAGLGVAPHAQSWLCAPTLGAPPPPLSGRRKALLIGINYFGTSAELKGCINDVKAMRGLLAAQGFSSARESLVVLTDDTRDPALRPTKANIIAGCRWLTADAQPGDVFFFHFSGHGAQQLDPDYAEEDGMDETIVPVDMEVRPPRAHRAHAVGWAGRESERDAERARAPTRPPEPRARLLLSPARARVPAHSARVRSRTTSCTRSSSSRCPRAAG